MTEQHYTIWAYSASTNTTQREINLEGGQYNPVRDQATADLWAQSFAMRLNQQGSNGVTDWQGRVLLERMGLANWIENQNSQQPGAQQLSGD
jgi:hypothetical protein